MESFICDAQDKAKNALQKSLQAAHLVWREQLCADQVKFESSRIMPLGLGSLAFKYF